MSERLIKIFSTFFGLGYLPIMPGTFGSFGGLIVYLLIGNSVLVHLLVTLLILIFGFFFCLRVENIFKINDPPQVVIDEVAGMLIALMFLPRSLAIMFCAFLIFRGFDTLKIFPTAKLEKAPFGSGIMLDDCLAGVYTNLVLRIAILIQTNF